MIFLRITSWKLLAVFVAITSNLLSCTNKDSSNSKNNINPDIVHFVFVSDSHYGLFRQFNGQTRSAEYVNGEMLKVINSLPENTLPQDGGVGENMQIRSIEMIVHGGDISNRQETGIQSANVSWQQFQTSFIDKITVLNAKGAKPELYVMPGNHDVSNAIGFYRSMDPPTDASSIAAIYNLMPNIKQTTTAEDYDYGKDKIHFAIERFNMLILFVNIWPGASERMWMAEQMERVPSTTPVVIFTHDPPNIESKHLTNPTPPHTINGTDKYENIIPDMPVRAGTTLDLQRDFANFVQERPNIMAYFHGDENYNEFYVYTGPDNNIKLHTFRVDSPLKGNFSANDESKLSFHVVSIDLSTMRMTVRECLWAHPDAPKWGQLKTISLQ